MVFYSLIQSDIIEKNDYKRVVEKAKRDCLDIAVQKLKEFDAMNESFFKAAMPDDTPDVVIRKRTNKLLRKKREKELKRLLG